MNVTEFLAKLEGVRKTCTGWEARCPAHEDRKASLSITEGNNGKILVHCHAGCAVKEIADVLGLKLKDLFPGDERPARPPHKRRIAKAYNYTDEAGTLLFQCVRYEPKDFKQRRPGPAGGWIWNLQGVRRVLYRLPALKAGVSSGEIIYIADGEKDVDALVEHGFAATCNPMGNDQKRPETKWLPEHTETLRGAAGIVMIVDKDEAGRNHSRYVARTLQCAVQNLKLIELPDRNGTNVKDAHDFFAAGGSADELRAIVERAPEFVPEDSQPHMANPEGSETLTPNAWFKKRFPKLAERHGEPVQEHQADKELPRVVDICEDFMAATPGADARPEAPTVFLPKEERFYAYEPAQGVFIHRREPELSEQVSKLFLECARACREHSNVSKLEFGMRDTAALVGVVRRARALLGVEDDFFNRSATEFIPVANGMLRLADMELLPFSPCYRRRNKLAVNYDASAQCPLFLDTLMRPALDDEDLNLIQRWCGLALLGENLAQKILLLMGTSGGGKGAFVRVICGIIGADNLASLRTSLLAERFELSRFVGRTLLYGADVADDFLNTKSASILKALVGADPVTVEFKNSNEVPGLTCQFNIIVTANVRLTVHLEGDIEAWRRRLVPIHYTRPKPEHAIPDLSERILREEGSGVLNWTLSGLAQARADGWQLHLNEHQQRRVDDLLLESDNLGEFVRRCLVEESHAALTLNDAYAAYVAFCNRCGWVAMTRNQFGRRIPDAVVQKHRVVLRRDIKDARGKDSQGWKGLRLKLSAEWSGKNPSEASAHPVEWPSPEASEAFSPLHPAGKFASHSDGEAGNTIELAEAPAPTAKAAEPDASTSGRTETEELLL